MQYKAVNVSDELLLDVVDIHSESYPDDHVSGKLSKSLLKKYYSYFLNNNNVYSLGCEEATGGKGLNGFVVFGEGFADKIKAFKKENVFSLVGFFLKNPALLYKVFVKRFLAFFQRADKFEEADFLILSIAARQDTKGVGVFLVKTAFDYCQRLNVDRLGLYVSCSNSVAVNFYFKSGFVVVGYVGGQYYMEKSLGVNGE